MINIPLKEESTMVALPKRTVEELKKLKKEYEPYYHLIARLIVFYKENGGLEDGTRKGGGAMSK